MGFFSKMFNTRSARLEELQGILCADRERIASNSYSIMDDLTDAMAGKGPSDTERRAMDHRKKAAKEEYLDLCIQDKNIAKGMKSWNVTREDLWNISEDLAKEGLAGKVKGKWMHLDAIANDFSFLFYVSSKADGTSSQQIAYWLMDYYKGRASEYDLWMTVGDDA
jgi:hypothetical protein